MKSLTPAGYGQIKEGAPSRKMLGAHRVSYEIHNGSILVSKDPHDNCVRHTCDNRSCVNPNHLILGTHQDNVDDMVKKGRQSQGEQHGGAKLTEEQVVEIRRGYVRGSQTHGQSALACQYGVNRSTISVIVNEKNWRN